MGLKGIESVLSFSEDKNMLHIDTRKYVVENIDLTVLNSHAETLSRMKLISGEHFISLASLSNGEYSVRLVAGNNVWVNKIIIEHL